MDRVDALVIGAGAVGLAVARSLAQAGLDTIVADSQNAIGQGVSSRNSEVIHAGLYYPPGSLKARLCVRGNELLYALCASHGVEHRNCGKLTVANSDAEQLALRRLNRGPRPMASRFNGWTLRRRRRWSPRCSAPQRCCRRVPAWSTATV